MHDGLRHLNPWVFAVALVALLLASPALAGSAQRLELTYNLLLETRTDAELAGPLDGFDSGDGFKLQLLPKQDCHVYLVVSRDAETFELFFPDRHDVRDDNRLKRRRGFVWPGQGWLRFDDQKGVERVYLIVSAVPVPELEKRYAEDRDVFPESVLTDLRDKYGAHGKYRRQMKGDRVEVRFKGRRGRPAVLVEEIALRHL